jgi:hypothetical protein
MGQGVAPRKMREMRFEKSWPLMRGKYAFRSNPAEAVRIANAACALGYALNED